jgi:hypothetical protein
MSTFAPDDERAARVKPLRIGHEGAAELSGRFKAMVLATVAMVSLLGSSAVALAGWCWSDPIIEVSAFGIDDQTVNIVVGIDENDLKHLDGAVDVTIRLPANVQAKVVYMDNIIPENVRFIRDPKRWVPGTDIEMSVKIHARSKGPKFPVAVLIEHQSKHGNGAKIKEGVSGRDLWSDYTIVLR